MSDYRPPAPTNPARPVERELQRWGSIYAREGYFYGEEPGPVARRAVRYHRAFMPQGGSVLDAGCGEGQDLAFLAERDYAPTGVELTQEGAEKARRLLAERGLPGQVVHQDLSEYLAELDAMFDLVLAVNSLQFMGAEARPALERLMDRVAPGGVLGVSLFGREAHEPEQAGTVYFFTFEEVMERFADWQRLEAARLWQWNVSTDEPQAFITMIARKAPPARSLNRL